VPRASNHLRSGGITTESCSRRGREMMPTVLKAVCGGMCACDSTLWSFASVEKIFLIALCAGELARAHAEAFESGGFGGVADFFNGFFVKRGVEDDSPRADVLLAQFELRFHQDEETGAKTFATEMKETSAVTKVTGSGMSPRRSSRALRSMRRTRGSCWSFQASWLTLTSTA